MSSPVGILNRKQVFSVTDKKIPSVVFDSDNYKAEYVVFQNNEFEDVLFDRVDLGKGIVFKDCIFKSFISFKNITIDQYDQHLSEESQSLVFISCIFNGRVYIGNDSLVQRAVVFNGCQLIKGLEIDKLNVTIESLKIEHTTIEEKLDIFRSHFKQGISLISTTINSYLRINNVKGSGINFTKKNVVTGNLHISNCQLEQGIVFNNGEFQDDVYLSLIETRQSGLSIIGSSFEKSFFINYHHGTVRPTRGISKFYISEANFKNGIYVKGNETLASATSPIVAEITITCSAKLTGSIVFTDLDVGIITLSGYNADANIEFKNIYVNEFFIRAYTNNSGLILSGVNSSLNEWRESKDNAKLINSLFHIDDSNLGKAQIYSVDFESFDNVIIGNTTLIDIATSMINWFSDEKLNAESLETARLRLQHDIKKSKEILASAKKHLILCLSTKKEVYRQIKVINEKRGDITLSLEFKRFEMNYLKGINKLKNKWYTSESLILATSSFSNDFGQNWLKALGWLLLFSFVCYIPIGFLTSDQLDYTKGLTSCSDLIVNVKVVFSDNFKTWFIILNPAHRINDITKNIESYSNWIFFWDLLSRVIIAYFLFQMVSAFRKYNK